MEDGKVIVDEGDGSGNREPSDPPRQWWLPAATFIGVAVVFVVIVATQRSTEEMRDNTLEASPAITTTTTTTVWWGATDEAVSFRNQVLDICERTSPVGVDGMQPLDEWVESLFIDGEWMYYFVEERLIVEAASARNMQNSRLVGLLESVTDNLEDAETATDILLHSTAAQGSDEWANQVALAERYCAKATATVLTMTTMIDDSPTRGAGQVSRDLAVAIEPVVRGLCAEGASPAGNDGLMDRDAWAESLGGGPTLPVHADAREAAEPYIVEVSADLGVHQETALDYVITNLDQADSAIHEAFRTRDDGPTDEWTYLVARIDRHCARATTTIATMVAMSRS
jgi:hypothetical protein